MQNEHSEYNKIVLDHYNNPRNYGQLKHATHSHENLNLVCGDELSVYINSKSGRIQEISFQARGCALMTASASVLFEEIRQKKPKISELEELDIETVEKLLRIQVPKNRTDCVRLPILTLKNALKN